MNTFDIVAWHWDGAIYCPACLPDEDKEPARYEGIGGPVFADDEGWEDACCGACGHSIRCAAGYGLDDAGCYPCAVEVLAEQLRDNLSGVPEGVALGALRAVLEPMRYQITREREPRFCSEGVRIAGVCTLHPNGCPRRK